MVSVMERQGRRNAPDGGGTAALKDWSLHSVQAKLVVMCGRLVSHAQSLVFRLAEEAVPRDVLQRVLERISRSCPAPA